MNRAPARLQIANRIKTAGRVKTSNPWFVVLTQAAYDHRSPHIAHHGDLRPNRW